MQRIFLTFVLLVGCMLITTAQTLKTKTIDHGGSGQFQSIAVKEKSMADFVIYRPKDLMYAHARQGDIPVLLFGNGGCSDTSIGYERMLTEIASHGYIVVAIGEMQDKRFDRTEGHTESAELIRGLDLLLELNRTKGSNYYHYIDSTRIAAAGHSCGGAQVLYNAADKRLKTYIILNAGMGDMEMAGAGRFSLAKLHAPILYVVGGPLDVAYENAQKDYDRISHVPVCLVNHPASGHSGTYEEQYGGCYGRLVVDWLDWQLKGKQGNAAIFLCDGTPKGYDGLTVKAKNFIDVTNTESLWIENGDRQIYGMLNRPLNGTKPMPLIIISHGFNGTHDFAQDYFVPFAESGWMTYAFDFPCGSLRSQSDSNTMEMSILDEESDLRAIINYFRRQTYVDRRHIVLMGESQGGLVSALTAARLDSVIDGLVLVYPALCIPDNWNTHYANIEDIPDTTFLWNVPIGRRFFVELRNINPFSSMNNFHKPVLIIHGDVDKVVPVDYSKRAAATYNRASLHIIHGAGHGFNAHERAEGIEQIISFLNKLHNNNN